MNANEINIQDFLDQIIDMVRPQALAKGLSFEHERARMMPRYVRADEKRLRQILVNLLSNAIKFTDEGTVRFDVAYRNQVATFTVSDTGRGIAEKDLSRIYEPFQRGEAESVRPLPGLGLGLTITKLLTNTLGGEISVVSEHGKGTTFKVRLMLSAIDRPLMNPPAEKKITGYTGPRRTVVVVDDNEDHRDLMHAVLSPLDFVVLTAGSGEACLTLIEGVKPDIFLIDISMPGMNGWQLVSRLRDAAQTAPILMLSANIGDGSYVGGDQGGHNGTIAKPVDLRQLCDKLALTLGLEWTYQGDEPAAPAPVVAELKSPGQSHIEELRRLGEIGYIRGIRAKLAELATLPENRPFAEALEPYVQAFDLNGYAAFLTRFDEQRKADDA